MKIVGDNYSSRYERYLLQSIRGDSKTEKFKDGLKRSEIRHIKAQVLCAEKEKIKKSIEKMIVFIKMFKVLLYLFYFGFAVGVIIIDLSLLFIVSSTVFILIHYFIFLFEKRRVSLIKKVFCINRHIYKLFKFEK